MKLLLRLVLVLLGTGWLSTVQATTCPNAILINPASLPTGQAVVCGAGNDLNATSVPATCGAASNSYKGGNEALYTFTPTTSGSYTIAYSGQTWTSIFVYNGCPTSGGTCVGSIGNSGSSKNLAANLTAGQTYFIWFDTWPTPNSPCAGTFTITAPTVCGNGICDGSETPATCPGDCPPPAGDNCTNAQNLASLVSPFAGTTVGYTNDFTNTCASGNTDPDRVFFLDVPSNYTLVIGQTVNGYDSENTLFYGGTCPGTTQIACFDDPDVQNVTWVNTTGSTQRIYWVQDGYAAGNSGTFTLAWTLTAPPTCIAPTAPLSANITTTSADLSWTCSGCTGSYEIQWGPQGFTLGTGTTVSGISGTTYTLGGLAGSTAYSYYVRQNCGVDGFSAWSAVRNFQTALVNDNCADAITLTSCTGGVQTRSGTTTGAQLDVIYTNCGAGGTATTEQGVWYIYNGDDNAVTMNTCNATGYDTRITVYSGTCGALTCVTANDDMSPACALGSFRSEVTFNAYAGTTYYVFVHGYQFGTNLSATGNFVLSYTCSALCLPAPTNDDCATAASLTVGSTCSGTLGFNSCASAPLVNPSCFSAFATLPDVWYSFTATDVNHDLVINLAGASSLGYAIYDACGGTQLACNANVVSGAQNSITGLTIGNTYYVQVLSASATSGTFDICVWENPCPSISGLSAGSTTDQATTLSWTANGTTAWDIYYAVSPAAVPTNATVPNIAAAATQPFTVTGLAPTTSYQFYVRNACAGNAGIWIGPADITTLAPPPANDEVCDAIVFSRVETSRFGLGASTLTCSSILGSTTSATNDPVNGCGTTASRAVWYQFTTPACFTGGTLAGFDMKFSTSNPGTDYDSRIAIFSSSDNTCNGTFTSISCNDDSGVDGCAGTGSGVASTIEATAGTTLEAGRTYWVRVSGFTGTSFGDFELTISVEPDAPTLTNSTTNPTGVIDATWPDVNAASYRLYWRPTGGSGYAIRALNTTSFSTNAGGMLLPNTSYDFWVNNWCGATLATSFASPVATLSTAAPSAGCSVPVPVCGTSTPTTIMMNWPEITGAVRIGVRYSFAGQTGYSQVSSLAYATTGGVSSFNFLGLQANMAYTFTFFVECDGRIFWSAPVTCSTGTALPRLAADVHSFEYEGTEYVDVRMTDFEYFAPAAGLPNHTVDVSTGKLLVTFDQETAANDVRFTLTPNVTTDLSTLTIYTAKATDANINIFDMNGALVQTMSMGEVNNGQQVSLNTSKMAAGVYYVNLRTGNTTTTEKLVIVR
jgi:hypothetical protein